MSSSSIKSGRVHHSFTASQLRKLSHTSPGEWRHLNWPRLETTSLEWFMMFMAFEITGNPWILCSHRKGGFGVVFPWSNYYSRWSNIHNSHSLKSIDLNIEPDFPSISYFPSISLVFPQYFWGSPSFPFALASRRPGNALIKLHGLIRHLSWDDEIPNRWKIKAMFETTNQYNIVLCYCMCCAMLCYTIL